MGLKPEETMSAYAAKLEKAAKWIDERWGALKGEMAELGLKWEPLFNRLPLQRQKEAEPARTVQLIRDHLIPLAGKQLEKLELKGLRGNRAHWRKTVRPVKLTDASAALL